MPLASIWAVAVASLLGASSVQAGGLSEQLRGLRQFCLRLSQAFGATPESHEESTGVPLSRSALDCLEGSN
eukprot:scaffold516_cov270-Pinguiococcus_pyrenoidosus.AAC.8